MRALFTHPAAATFAAKRQTYLWPLEMSVLEASFTGTFRIILILLVVWWVLRFFVRMQQPKKGDAQQSTGPQRPKGEVRIENVPQHESSAIPKDGSVTDADFEEIK